MRKLKEVLRLYSLGLKQQQIARSCLIAQSTVHKYLKAAASAGLSWPLPADWDERRLEEVVSGAPRPAAAWHKAGTPDFDTICAAPFFETVRNFDTRGSLLIALLCARANAP